MELFSKAFTWFAQISSKLPQIDFKAYFIVVLALIGGVALIIALTLFASPCHRIKRASTRIIKYLADKDSIDDDNLSDFSAACFSAKIPQSLRDAWVQFLGVRFGYPSEIISEQNVFDKEVKKARDLRPIIFISIAFVLLGLFSFWGYGALKSSEMGVIHCVGLIFSAILYFVLAVLGRKQYKLSLQAFNTMQEDIDAKINLQVDKNFAVDSSPITQVASLIDEIISRNTSKYMDGDTEVPVAKLDDEESKEGSDEESPESDGDKSEENKEGEEEKKDGEETSSADDSADKESEKAEENSDESAEENGEDKTDGEQETHDENGEGGSDEPAGSETESGDVKSEEQSESEETPAEDSADADKGETEEEEPAKSEVGNSDETEGEPEETQNSGDGSEAPTESAEESGDGAEDNEPEDGKETDLEEQPVEEPTEEQPVVEPSPEEDGSTETLSEELEETPVKGEETPLNETEEAYEGSEEEPEGEALDNEDGDEPVEEQEIDLPEELPVEDAPEEEAPAQEEDVDLPEEAQKESIDLPEEAQEDESVAEPEPPKPVKLAKLPQVVDLMLGQNFSPVLKRNVADMFKGFKFKYKDSPENLEILESCIARIEEALSTEN